jgi:hypothetical protein
MSFWEIIWVLFLLVAFVLLVISACAAPAREEPDTACCRGALMVLTGFLLMLNIASHNREPYVPNPKFFTIWNRNARDHPKAGFQITGYRQPDASLPAAEYMMGVEMAKSNSCHAFNFDRAEDIARFRRCAHFFPEMYSIYRTSNQDKVGVSLE